jgi:hypothetical protein
MSAAAGRNPGDYTLRVIVAGERSGTLPIAAYTFGMIFNSGTCERPRRQTHSPRSTDL